jgi:hypothetical protein
MDYQIEKVANGSVRIIQTGAQHDEFYISGNSAATWKADKKKAKQLRLIVPGHPEFLFDLSVDTVTVTLTSGSSTFTSADRAEDLGAKLLDVFTKAGSSASTTTSAVLRVRVWGNTSGGPINFAVDENTFGFNFSFTFDLATKSIQIQPSLGGEPFKKAHVTCNFFSDSQIDPLFCQPVAYPSIFVAYLKATANMLTQYAGWLGVDADTACTIRIENKLTNIV